MGIAYDELGESNKAIEYYEKSLEIDQRHRDREGLGNVYGNLGNAYHRLGNYDKAIDYHKMHLAITLELKDQLGEGRASCNLGNAYHRLREYSEAIKYHQNDLRIALECENKAAEGRAYCNLGNIYHILKKPYKAIEHYEGKLKIALNLGDRVGEGITYGNLGSVYHDLGKYSQAEKCFLKGIEIAASLQQDAKKAKWQVTLFEHWSRSYIGLEKTFLLQSKNREALEISDKRRSRALSQLLYKKNLFNESQIKKFDALLFKDVQELAGKLETVFIVYSLSSLNDSKSIKSWIVSAKGDSPQTITLSIPDNIFTQLDQIFKMFPYKIEEKRPKRGEKHPSQIFDDKLTSWYDILIKPLESYLHSKDSTETLTFIPDGFLAHLPFGAFYDTQEKKYLIEKYPVTVAPSIQVLSLLDQLPKVSSQQVLLMGNPTTPKAVDNKLKYSEIEVRDTIAPLMDNFDQHILTQKDANIENIFKYAPHSRWIHIAAHGMAQQKPPDDPHSVFEGFFKLAPDETHPLGELHAKEVNKLAIKADLVFMSACHLGRGNLQKEGSIGPIWSFLGAGARSTIASYWPLPEGGMTVKMVDTFYKHYLGKDTQKLNKAKALQQAVLMAMETERDKPRQWGAFFLSGLIE
ncbi:hypothetical protein RSOCI_03880 [Rhabdochlamydiaceae symbiont of Dictyostelium giganteum]